ncbi:MAG TPA: hypothetical protein ENG95_05810 [Nitrospirae bacterium]|nr:hypothetical protein BMS3Abin10_00200 [bacterium BMS3Abin10]GBE39832.1 hypothetical protein BMS3Bbin08_02464 [bacterium BMS3Bbin08]HDH51192.1 hypothetical protein [Nitrospirota bacterium]HDK81833.1 hypothetical protein [Nitrospirota bacterium]HDO26137.1 hypothetical protein [Nitrospirota bacterium]
MKKKLPQTFPGYVIHGLLFIGLISAFAFRAIIVFERLEPSWVRPAWYTGVVGYIGFFLYRYAITRKRKRVIREYDLIEKVRADSGFSEDDREAITFLLSSIKKSREDINYLVIFLLSVLAVAADLLFVLFK